MKVCFPFSVAEARWRSPSEAAVGGLPTEGGYGGMEVGAIEPDRTPMEGAMEWAIVPRSKGDRRAIEGERKVIAGGRNRRGRYWPLSFDFSGGPF
jgi:hypothetical protein